MAKTTSEAPQRSGILSVEEIELLVQGHAAESGTVEFKETLVLDNQDRKRDLVCDVTALANASGGCVIVGICEEGQPGHAARWGSLSAVDAERIRKQILDLCSSHIDPAITDLHVRTEVVPDKTSLVVIDVPCGLGPFAVTGFNEATDYYIRVDDRKRQMKPAELQDAFLRSRQTSSQMAPANVIPGSQVAVTESLHRVEREVASTPFFGIAAAPLSLKPGILDTQSSELMDVFRRGADGRSIGTTLGWVANQSQLVHRGRSTKVGPYLYSLRDDCLMSFAVLVREESGYTRDAAGQVTILNQYAVIEYPLSFMRMYRSICGFGKGPYCVQMVYGNCEHLLLYPRRIGMSGFRPTPLLEESDRGHVPGGVLALPSSPYEFNALALLVPDKVVFALLKELYQACGYPQEDVPFWDGNAMEFNLDTKHDHAE